MPIGSPASGPRQISQKGVGELARAAGAQAGLLVLGACLLTYATIAFGLRWSPPKALREVGIKEALSRQTEFVWVDVRNPERFESAHIPGAVHFSEATAGASLEEVRRVWKSNRKLGVYGEGIGSDRAERVAKLLKTELGTREVYLLEGGWAAWPRP
jgi:rhodanese-related sulfurtransferase